MGQKKQSYEVGRPMDSLKLPAVAGKIALWIPGHFLLFIMLISFILFMIAVLFYNSAPGYGKAAGMAVGSFEGVTSGLSEGAKAGKEAGLSAEDTRIRVGNEIRGTEKLQVLLVDMKLSDIFQEGDQYAALLSLEGEAAFTVDLSRTQVFTDEATGNFIMEISEPEFEFYLDDSSIQVVDDYKAPLFDGTSKNGYTGYLNSREKINQRVEEELAENDAMLTQARNSALQQVGELAKAICGNTPIEIRFTEGEE